MAKVNVSIPDSLLSELDSFARKKKLSRSGLLKEATERYLAQLEAERRLRGGRGRRGDRL